MGQAGWKREARVVHTREEEGTETLPLDGKLDSGEVDVSWEEEERDQ